MSRKQKRQNMRNQRNQNSVFKLLAFHEAESIIKLHFKTGKSIDKMTKKIKDAIFREKVNMYIDILLVSLVCKYYKRKQRYSLDAL